MKAEKAIFKKGSTTYYFSTRFFPKRVRADVFRLYSFVRVADNYVDEQPAQPQKLLALERDYKAALLDDSFSTTPNSWDKVDERVIKNIVMLTRKYHFEPEWVEAFLGAMKQDINPKPFDTLDDSLAYVHGSAEVIGLMMNRILGVDHPSNIKRTMQLAELQKQHRQVKLYEKPAAKLAVALKLRQQQGFDTGEISRQTALVRDAAMLQGRAMQWVNFIRDIAEDNQLGRCYFPQQELEKYDLPDLLRSTAEDKPQHFARFMKFQIKRYREWQQEADQGMRYIPRRLRIPLKTAVDMYDWTAGVIEHDPLVVFRKKVKPTKKMVIRQAARNIIDA